MISSRTEMMIELNNISGKNEESRLEFSDKENKMNNTRNMKVSNRHLGSCRGICENYRGTKHPSGWYVNGQVRCTGCMNFLTPKGVEIRNGRKLCKCCHSNVRTRPHSNSLRKERIVMNQNDPDQEFEYPLEGQDEIEENSESTKKETPAYFEETTDKRNYSELREFIEDSIRLQANYQLVMLKYLVSHKRAHKGEISESLAYYNNKDISNLAEVKKLFNVPVYDVLIKHGFVNQIVSFGIKEYELNVQLSEYQQYEINDLLEKRIEEWNNEHGIPENQFNVVGINWDDNQNSLIESSYWIWSVTPENWEIVKSKNIWGSKIPFRKIESRVSPNDSIIFYVIGTKAFKGIFEVNGHWYDDSENFTWFEERKERKKTHISGVKLNPVILGTASLENLENLSIFIGKNQDLRNLVLKGGGGYPSNTGKPIPFDDFSIIKELLEKNSLSESPEEIEYEDKVPEPNLSTSTLTELDDEIHEIPFDGISYILSLPNGWINDNGLKEGDPLAISRLDKSILQVRPIWLKIPRNEQEFQTAKTTLSIKPDDEVRKIQFDNKSHFITLPNKWIIDMGLQQDDSVLVSPKSNTILEITPIKNESNIVTDNLVSIVPEITEEKIIIPDRKIFETNSEGITINEMKILRQEVIQIGQILKNDELTQKFGVGNMGGIRYTSKNNLIVLCDTQSSHYNDRIDPEAGIILYTGEGQMGDQELTGGNFRIANSSNLSLLYFVEVPQEPGMKKRGALDNIYKFIGKVKYLKHSLKVENDSSGNPRIVIKFLLEIEK